MRQREGQCDLDTVVVLGMVSIRDRLADAVYRLKYANDARSYDDALAGVFGMARSMDVRHRWRLKRESMQAMSKAVLDYWLNDACTLCTGVGYEVIPGTPHLSDRACQRCHGTRKSLMPWISSLPSKPEGKKARVKEWYALCRDANASMQRHRLLLVALETTERAIGERMKAKLARAA